MYTLVLQYLIIFSLLSIIEAGGKSWARVLWAISTSLFGTYVIVRIFMFIHRQYTIIHRNTLLPFHEHLRLVKFDFRTVLRILDLYFSYDLVLTNVFFTFWLFGSGPTTYFTLTTGSAFAVWSRFFYTAVLVNMGTGYGLQGIPKHVVVELITAYSVYGAFFFRALILSYTFTQVAATNRKRKIAYINLHPHGI